MKTACILHVVINGKKVELISQSNRHLRSYKLWSCVHRHIEVISSLSGHKIFIQQLRIDKGNISTKTQMQRVSFDSLKTKKQARLFPTSDVNH